jgi:hypothetical protein
MIGMDSDHCQILRESLSGQREINEQTFASLTILTERLERLKKSDKIFDSVTFSAAVKKLKGRKNPIAVT